MTGSGTLADPFVIWDVNDLQAVQNNLTAYYELGQNIDASATSGWNGGLGFDPIGGIFLGQFDGKGYTINNLFINRPLTDGVGLFYITGVSLIKNAKLTNVNITGRRYVGALVASNQGGDVENCSSTGTVTGTRRIGGLCGELISGSGDSLWSSCTVTATGGAADSNIGGLYGAIYGTVRKSFATGNVTANNIQSFVGGFVGSVHGQLYDCYALGNATGGQYIGGFCGDNVGTITNCYSTGVPTGTAGVGGFCGDNEFGTITSCFWDTQTSGQATSSGGTGRPTAPMKSALTFIDAGWGLGTIWGMTSSCNDGYACLLGVTASCAWDPIVSLPPSRVATLPATSITENSAQANGMVEYDRGFPGDVSFEWGITVDYGQQTPWLSGYGSGDMFWALIYPLAPGMAYHFRARFRNRYGVVYGVDMSFATLSAQGTAVLIDDAALLRFLEVA